MQQQMSIIMIRFTIRQADKKFKSGVCVNIKTAI